jgi:hypothetical protein
LALRFAREFRSEIKPRASATNERFADVSAGRFILSNSFPHVRVRFIRRDVAVVHVTNQISGFLNPSGSTEPPPIEGRVFAMQLMTKAIAFFGFAKAARAQLQGTPEDSAAINAVVVEMTEGFSIAA